MADVRMPAQSEHDEYILSWLLQNPGPHQRKDVVAGAVATGPWNDEQRGMPSTSKSRTGGFRSQLHQQAWYRIWPLRDELGLVKALGDGSYELTDAGRVAAQELHGSRGVPSAVGVPFPMDRVPPDDAGSPTVVFEYDPDARDRQTRAHEQLVIDLATEIRALGFEPLLPTGDVPRYDVAFVVPGTGALVVIEVKSLGDANPNHQLRLGLGQVLHYTYQLSADHRVLPVLAVPVAPPPEWDGVCAAVGVQLIIAPDLGEPLSRLAAAG